MLNVRFAYKTLEDFTASNVVAGLAENMLFITQDFSDGQNITGHGRGVLSDYFNNVPKYIRAEVFATYIDLLADDGFDIDAIREQAKM